MFGRVRRSNNLQLQQHNNNNTHSAEPITPATLDITSQRLPAQITDTGSGFFLTADVLVQNLIGVQAIIFIFSLLAFEATDG